MALFLQRIFDGLLNGSIYAALAVALAIVHRSSGVLNLAQGEMAMFSSFIVVVFVSPVSPRTFGTEWVGWLGTPWPIWGAILAAMVLSFVGGALIERLVIRPLDQDRTLDVLGATLGMFLLINAGASKLWGNFFRIVESPFPTEVDDYALIGGARLRYETVGIIATLLLAIALLAVLQRRTRLGLGFRLIASDREAAALMGVQVGSVVMMGWGIAAAVGALAAGLVAHPLGVDTGNFVRLLIFALAAAMLGGLDSPGGALIGGFAFGVFEALLIGYVDFVSSDVAIVWALGALVVVLIVRPQGLFGKRAVKVNT